MIRKFSNFVDLLRYRADKHHEKIAFTFLQDGEAELGSLTYQQLDRQARAIAAMLQSQNAKGERALLLYPPGLEFIAAFFGCLYAGAIAIPAYPPRPNRSLNRLQGIVCDAQATFALTTNSLLTNIEGRLTQGTGEMRCITTDNIPDLADYWQELSFDENALAFLQYTSGSTGKPKGVIVSHGNLLHNSELINRCFQDTPDSKGVSWLPPYHDMGLIGGILQPIYVGASQALMSPVTFLQRPFRWLQAISRYQATTSGGPNFAYDLCVNLITPEQRATLDLSSWNLAFTGAESIRAETLERFASYLGPCGFRKEAFYPCYGLAEATLIVSGGLKEALPVLKTVKGEALEKNQAIAADSSENGTSILVGCGNSVATQQIVIANQETLRRCAPNEIGEIWVWGESVTQGYWRQPSRTEKTFKAYLADTGEGPFLRTGDLGFLQDGELFVTGRLKDLIVIRGRNYYPQDIELTVEKSHPALRSGCGAAFAVDVEGEERLAIVQEVKRSYLRSLDGDEVLRSIRKAVVESHELQPFAILLLKTGSIPKTSSGKITRYACKAGFQQGGLDVVGEWRDRAVPRKQSPETGRQSPVPDATEAQAITPNSELIQAWLVSQVARRLEISPDEIDIREPFANYGLDSVQAVRLSAELEDWLGRKLAPTLAYDYPTIETLAGYLGGLESREKSRDRLPSRDGQSPIAIVGIGCRFPGAKNPKAFWELLRNGKDAITRGEGRSSGGDWGGFLDGVDEFDAQFFGISPREAQGMDPQQRLLLEVSWEALEWAGLAGDKLAGSLTGVFVGISSSDYSQIQLRSGLKPDAYAGTGNAHSIAANRLSYIFDFRGPSLTVDTACSSSLVAVHLACQSLQSRECDMALVGGVNLILSPELTQTFSEAGMMAADGRCKTFDASADGYVRGEGCGVAVLKRLDDAIRDGDNILALIRGSAVNQDGRSNGLTAPNGPAQQACIARALDSAGCSAGDISYIEAHGTGTSLGDPIEVNSLKAVFPSPPLPLSPSPPLPVWIGSVKTNIGHLEAAAGIAGLIKVVLCLQHGEIPPNLHFNRLNPHIDLENTILSIPTELQPWVKGEQLRLAGVSSFGFGGTNAHVILGDWELAPEKENTTAPISDRPFHLLTLSAKGERALEDLVRSYEEFLMSHGEVSLADICFTANTGRSHFNYRLAVVADSTQHLGSQLSLAAAGKEKAGLIFGQVSGSINQKVAFLFTGQGSQYVGMGYQLYHTQPTFRAALDRCAEILDPYLERPLLEVLYPQLASTEEGHSTQIANSLDETAYTQPALFALEYALAQLWQSWGIKPAVVMGHSVGEYVAACVAGVFSLEDGLKLIACRASLMQALPEDGEMVAVFASEGVIRGAIKPFAQKVAIAAINGTESIVISGEKKAVAQAIATLKAQKVRAKRLKVSRAFHSPLMEPMLADFERVARQITYSSPQLDIISNVTGEVAGAEIATAQYWINHVLQPVRFAASMELLEKEGYQIFLEIGPKPTLLSMCRHYSSVEGLWLSSLRPGKADWQQILESLAVLSVRGVKIDWSGFDRDYQRNRVILPTYPFRRQRYWIEEKNKYPQQNPKKDWLYQIEWQPRDLGLVNKKEKTTAAIANHPSPVWLIFADRGGVGETIARQLENEGNSCVLVYNYPSQGNWSINPASPEDFHNLFQEALSNVTKLEGIIHLWSLDAAGSEQLTISSLERAQVLGCGSVLHLIQALMAQSKLKTRIWLITRGTQFVESGGIGTRFAQRQKAKGKRQKGIGNGEQGTGNRELLIAQSPLWGLGKVIALECPEYWGGMIDLAPSPDKDETAFVLKEITGSDGEDHLAFRNGQCYVARLKQIKDEKLDFISDFSIQNSEFSYLITGGLGALGLKVARWLVERGAKYLVLLGRRGASNRAALSLEALERTGAKILVISSDVSREQDLVQVLETIKVSMPPLRGIIHAAGILDDDILQGLDWERFAKVMAPKVKGAWNLHNLTQHLPLDFFVMFSSAASLLGSPGQGNYAAANTFLDAIAHYRQARGLSALSVNWGPFADGMAASTPLAAKGFKGIETELGLQVLAQLIRQSSAQVGVLAVNWAELSKQFPYLVQSPYFQEIISELPEAQMVAEEPIIFEKLLEMPPVRREEFLRSYLHSEIARILQMEVEQLSPAESLLDLGMDSLMVMEAINQLRGDLQLMLYPREFYERPRIDALARYLAAEFERSHGKSSEVRSLKSETGLMVETEDREAREGTSNSISEFRTQNSGLGKLPGIVFILSSPRSGSTLLRVMLAGHPALLSPPELHLLPFNTMAQRSRELALSHLGEGLERAFMELRGIDAQASQRLVADLVKGDLSIREVYRMLIEGSPGRLLVDKSPTYASSRETLERAEELFAGAKYIHLVRHPYGVIESFCRMRMDKLIGKGEGNPYQLAEWIWTNSNRNILDFFEGISPERYHQVRYEELVKEPTKVMEVCCEFLGIPFDSSLLTPYEGKRMTDGVYDKSMALGDPNFLGHNQIDSKLGETWRDIKLPSRLGDLACRVAAAVNYELPQEVGRSSPVHRMGEYYLDVRGLNLCLCTWGPEDGPLVFLVHGILEQGAAWLEVAVLLAEKGYRVVAPDLRGHGCSAHVGWGGSYNLLDFLGDIDVIVEKLTDKPLTLVGHSLGSVVAAIFASIRPQKVKNLVLVETVLPTEVNEEEAVEQLATHLDYLASPPEHPVFPDVSTAAERLRLATPALSESLAMKLAQRITEPCEGGVRWRWAPLLRTRAGIGFNGIGKSRYLGLLRRIKAPITLVYGDSSNFNRAEDLSSQEQAMPEAERVILSGGHNLHLEAPSNLARLISQRVDKG
ncbi:MAG: hybrid fatty acyl-AMP ligase/type I polyketide synthase [Xenococcaceae cyanobacterium]